jgi:hypothetical protein
MPKEYIGGRVTVKVAAVEESYALGAGVSSSKKSVWLVLAIAPRLIF